MKNLDHHPGRHPSASICLPSTSIYHQYQCSLLTSSNFSPFDNVVTSFLFFLTLVSRYYLKFAPWTYPTHLCRLATPGATKSSLRLHMHRPGEASWLLETWGPCKVPPPRPTKNEFPAHSMPVRCSSSSTRSMFRKIACLETT